MISQSSVTLNKTTDRSLHKFAYINVLRGLAVLGVLLVHTSNNFSILFLPHTIIKILQAGRYGVQLFFFASAFTIFYSYANRINEVHVNQNFFIRRFFRIAPLYYIAIIYYLYQNGFGPSYSTGGLRSIHTSGIIENFLFVHGFDPYYINSIVPGGWSITVEICFYCLIPFIFSRIKSINNALYFLSVTIIFKKIFTILMVHFVSKCIPEKSLFDDFIYFYLPNQLPVFAIGILFYFIKQNETAISPKPLVLIFFLVITEVFTKKLDITEHILLSLSFILLASALSKFLLDGWFYKIIQYLGTISYSMYLTHFAVIFLLLKIKYIPVPTGRLNNLFIFIAEYFTVLLLTAGIASLSYKYLEVPGQEIGKSIIKKISSRRSPKMGV